MYHFLGMFINSSSSLPVWGAWIEITMESASSCSILSRSLYGGRGLKSYELKLLLTIKRRSLYGERGRPDHSLIGEGCTGLVKMDCGS